MVIFDYTDYKLFIRDFIAQMPKRGRGQLRKLALYLGVNSTAISQIFNGVRDLTQEQGLQVALYYGFNELETRYFLNLILKERSGTQALKNYYLKEEEKLRSQAQAVKSRIIPHQEISENDKAVFYSNWYYSAIRMASAISKYQTVDELVDFLKLDRAVIQKAVHFLLETGLCVEKNGRLGVGPQHTHLDSSSAFINNHRRNWRIKALENINQPQQEDLFYSGVMTLSHKDYLDLRAELVNTISKFLKKIEKSPEETVVCFNIDWFQL